ncbi:p-aminobenzoyl-glutamate to p-aminobenzoate hydrolase [Dehalogenimonas sp. WBC-2]|nr:p-aminobenzoyl-glutamate to p-aminobenzoate hydrolase [Dehalogenimonas sp. WBC-2]
MATSLDTIKNNIKTNVQAQSADLKSLALKIHANPELGFKESQAADWLSAYLKQKGFKIEHGIAGLKTAFRAIYGKGKPVIALVGEYDALPEVGHACGHNLIGTASAGAAVALKQVADEFGGQIQFIGTPAEELFGGKIIMVQKGIFDNLDAALMVHPESGVNTATTTALACVTLYVEYFGKESHAASDPSEGVNALDAMVIAYSAVSLLRQHIKSSARVHGIITDGGKAANVVPGHSAGNFLVRALDLNYLEELKERVLNCFKAGAQATGARLECKWDAMAYHPLKNNMALAELYRANVSGLGLEIEIEDKSQSFGSTDMGNVSQVTPSLHGFIAIAPREVIGHTREFADAAASESGLKGMLDAATALGMTAADIMTQPDILGRIRAEFAGNNAP